jgi:hypothetical protein
MQLHRKLAMPLSRVVQDLIQPAGVHLPEVSDTHLAVQSQLP